MNDMRAVLDYINELRSEGRQVAIEWPAGGWYIVEGDSLSMREGWLVWKHEGGERHIPEGSILWLRVE